MKRRIFLTLPFIVSSSFGFFSFFKSEDRWIVLESVQNHLFSKNKTYPSATEFGATRYLKMSSKDDSFDSEDLVFLFKGVEEIQDRGYKSSLSTKEKQNLLTKFSKEQFGKNWISMVLNYTLEALFADPIYGGNKKEIGWKSFNHHVGKPQPKSRYGKRDV